VNSLASSACAWVARADSPFTTLKDIWAAAKSGKSISFGAYSTDNKMYVDYIARREGVQIKGVTFKSVPEVLQAVLGGHVDFGFSGGSHAQYVQKGTLRVLAATGDSRTGDSPDVPTLKEMGYGVTNCAIFAIGGPKGIPADIVNKLADAIAKAMHTEEAAKFLEARDNIALNDGPSGLTHRMKEDAAAFADIKKVLK
jgi:tripartite-type tricarboxylate transporter receptor subunit TctC